MASTTADEVERRIRLELLDERSPAERGHTVDGAISICPCCRGAFLVPGEDCALVEGYGHEVELYCVNCGWDDTVVLNEFQLEAFDRELDSGYADLLWTLEVVWVGNEEQAILRFADALAVDAILPEDF